MRLTAEAAREAAEEKVLMLNPNVHHPAHYCVGGIETYDFIQAKGLSYALGNVVKYVSRAYYKGSPIEDLEKAQYYLNLEITRIREAETQGTPWKPYGQ